MAKPGIDVCAYFRQFRGQTVTLVGVFPLPLGGIAVHLKRLEAALIRDQCLVWRWDVCRQQQGISQLRYYLRLLQFGLFRRSQVLLYHTLPLRSTPLELVILILIRMLTGARLVVVLHSGRFVSSMRKPYRWMISRLLRHQAEVVMVGKHLQQELWQNGLRLSGRITVDTPFLPPEIGQRTQILARTSADLNCFMTQSKPLIIVAVTRLDDWQGEDLYGTDLALAAFERFKSDFPQAGLLLVVGNMNGRSLQIGSQTYLLKEWVEEIWPLIGLADLFLRPTRTDVSSISVAEALWQGVPTIASDCCPRLKGVTLFKSGKADDLYLKMVEIWQKSMSLKPGLRQNKLDMLR